MAKIKGRLVSTSRKFNKKEHNLEFSSDSKKRAKDWAKERRSAGATARIVPGRSRITGRKGFWHVYVHFPKKK